MTFWVCHYHIVWSTRLREPLITPEIERCIIDTLRRQARTLDSPILAINMVSDHLHVAVSIPPKLSVMAWVRRAKGASSYTVNSLYPDLPTRFQWQRGYGVLTFGAKASQLVIDYVKNQKERHQQYNVEPYMEIMGNDED